MKKFQFSLEAVAQVRKHEVRQEQLALARTLRGHDQALAEQQELRARLRRTAAEGPAGDRVDASDFMHWEERRKGLRRRMESTGERLARWALELEEDRHRLVQARRQEEAIEKLRERRYLEFARELLRREQSEIDETANRRASMRKAA